jgi:hypothetical protein
MMWNILQTPISPDVYNFIMNPDGVRLWDYQNFVLSVMTLDR